jgi:hypothetical protein
MGCMGWVVLNEKLKDELELTSFSALGPPSSCFVEKANRMEDV